MEIRNPKEEHIEGYGPETITMVVDNAPFFAYDQYGWDEEVDLNLAEFFSIYYHDEFEMEPEFQSHLDQYWEWRKSVREAEEKRLEAVQFKVNEVLKDK